MSKNKYETRNCLKLIFALAIVLGLFACKAQGNALESLDPNYYDQSWLTGKPCAAPCWYGLEPGVATRQDSINRVEQLPFVDKKSMQVTNYSDSVGISFSYKIGQGSTGLILDFEPDVLDSINFPPNYRITFDQVVEKLGNPDGYWILPASPETPGCSLRVVWKNKRIVLWKEDGEMGWFSFKESLCLQIHDRDGNLPENMLIEKVQIDSPSGIKSIMDTHFHLWKGFAK
jgi:hypothetical protein